MKRANEIKTAVSNHIKKTEKANAEDEKAAKKRKAEAKEITKKVAKHNKKMAEAEELKK